MRLTPLDIQSHRFSSRLRGLDPLEVESFLQLVGEDYEALLRERDALAGQVRALEGRVQQLARNEKILQETLVTAQALTEDLKRTAVKESELLISQAEVRAEKILESAQRRAAELSQEIREMRGLRTRVATALRNTLESHLAALDGLLEEPEETDKVAYLTRGARTPRQG